MQLLRPLRWDDYELLDCGESFRLERFGKYILSRPDPQIIWKKKLPESEWQKADAVYERTTEDKGLWVKKNPNLPYKWILKYKNLSFYAKLTPFKHTGIFPEQTVQWDFIQEKILQSKRAVNILNLFAYTGIASLAAAAAGGKVTHVDASFPAIGWAKENQDVSNLRDKPIRWIEDDCLKFVGREIKRGVKYDGIIMDPPAFGHGPEGQMWKFNKDFPKLFELCMQILSGDPLFILVNAYAISSSHLMLKNVFEDFLGDKGEINSGELTLEENRNNRLLSTGIFASWSSK